MSTKNNFFNAMDEYDIALLDGEILAQDLKDLPLEITKQDIKDIEKNEYTK